jgi:hypothetical protein
MRSAKRVGRTVGVLLFVQLFGLMFPFILINGPIAFGDFVAEAAGSAPQIRVAVLLFFANALVTIAIAVVAFPVFRRYGYGAALWILSMSVIWFCIQAVDSAHILSMMTLSERFAAGGGANAELYNLLAAMLRSTRRYVHYSELLVIDIWMAVVFGSLLRYALVPQMMAGACVLAVVLHTAAISLSAFVGYNPYMPLGVVLAFTYVAMGGWLVAKGFSDRSAPEDLNSTAVALAA